jgi:hypothetical protein
MTTFAQGDGGPPTPRRRRKFLERQLEDPVRLKRVKRWFYASLAALAVTEFAWPHVLDMGHAHFWFEDLPAWGSIFGLVACVVIIIASKLLGKLWLTRPDNYYDS